MSQEQTPENGRTDGDKPRAETNDSQDWVRFRELLDSQHKWPTRYPFKFIVPRAGLTHLEQIFAHSDLTVRASKRGNYVSVSVAYLASSADEIVDIYVAASSIEGVISL
jgi:putative lipoic acid-binding regulatory protein